jgi:hypothetical protein
MMQNEKKPILHCIAVHLLYLSISLFSFQQFKIVNNKQLVKIDIIYFSHDFERQNKTFLKNILLILYQILRHYPNHSIIQQL